MKYKKYYLKEDDFRLFVEECEKVLSLLGIRNAPITFAFEKPPDLDSTHLAGSIIYEDSQKILIYLSPEWPREISDTRIRYEAVHEAVEIHLINKFYTFCEECVKEGKVDNSKWEKVVHEALNSLVMLYDETLLKEVTTFPIFESVIRKK